MHQLHWYHVLACLHSECQVQFKTAEKEEERTWLMSANVVLCVVFLLQKRVADQSLAASQDEAKKLKEE
jgi:hypothetical protein